jgi:hypothetical protein
MKKIRYIFIDCENKLVKEIYLDEGLTPIYELLKCELVEAVYVDTHNHLFVDEEGLFKVNDNSNFFVYDNNTPIIGSGIVTAHNEEGETIDTNLLVEDITNKVKFYHISELDNLKNG